MTLKYRLLNVFALEGDPFSGNPLCVFEDARGLGTETMQSLARQFNLSETTFIGPSDRADAMVRIFTPEYEMPFAGHPTLGTVDGSTNVVSERLNCSASACIVASSSPRPSSKTHSGLPASTVSAKTLTIR